jgi:vanillate O-demethylase ferredoxin subunit
VTEKEADQMTTTIHWQDLLQIRVKSVTWEAERINSYRLEAADGRPLPPFTAGAHIDLRLPIGMIRSYSLFNDQDDRDHYDIAVSLDSAGRGGSRYVHEQLRAGDMLTISAPSNNFRLCESSGHSILIAGGIGITPLLSMVQRLAKLGRPWELHYVAHKRAGAAFLDRLDVMKAGGDARIDIVCSDDSCGRTLDLGQIVAQAPCGADFYCCGPSSMLSAFQELTAALPAGQVHAEYFAAKEAPAIQGGFEIVLQRSARRIAVPAGKTILDALLDAGLYVPYACSQGVCGTCKTAVLDGVPDHRDAVFNDDERAANKSIIVCCSGSKSPTLVLDL